MAQKAPSSIVASFTTEQAKITAEMRELDLLIESTQTEVNRLKQREDAAKTEQRRRLEELEGKRADAEAALNEWWESRR